MQDKLITLLILLPLLGAGILLIIPARHKEIFRRGALLVTILQLLIALSMVSRFQPGSAMQLVEHRSWINMDLGTWGIWKADYWVGVDGLSLPLILLSVVVLFFAALAARKIKFKQKGFFVLFLVLDAAVIGSFTALDLLLFYLFFEFMLLPMYFMIGIWGGPRREYASMKFFLYTLFGSILILIVFIGLYLSGSDPGSASLTHTFGLPYLQDIARYTPGAVLSPDTPGTLGWFTWREWAFLLLLTGFAIKLPAVPLHTWLPDAHVEAPTAVSVLLAALLLKVGGYGIIRVAYPLFPAEAVHFSWLVAGLGVVSILYGAFNSLASKDLKRLIAYSSVSHMGFVLVGIASVTGSGVTGAVFQMVSHGILSAMLFLLAGMLEERTGNRMIENHSGLSSRLPHYTLFVLIAFFASLGLPGFSGFIGELFVLLGAFTAATSTGYVSLTLAFAALGGLILAAGYFLWAIQRMFFGPFAIKADQVRLKDLTFFDVGLLLPLSLFTLVLGVYPQPLLNLINGFTVYWLQLMTTHQP
ncbi:MAG: NADH-quinone oxidoreductase subunit M [Cyclobacteriaceae bacterium]